jgi:hypothetical protein
MPEDVFGRNQLFQQVIDTTITCRTIVKYSSTLSEEQKEEVLREIEATLDLLEKQREQGSPLADQTVLPASQKPDQRSASRIDEEEAFFPDQESAGPSVQHLYRLYQSYFNSKPGRGMAALETRYRTVMRALDQIQELAGQQGTPAFPELEQQLGRARGFVTALYTIFREFALMLSNIMDGRAIDVDTETLDLLPEPASVSRQCLVDMTPLMEIYGKHLRVQERRGTLVTCAREASAFLVFLEENLGQSFARRTEIAAQLKVLAGLLNELTDLLSDYEQAIGTIIQSPSASL